jgi:hypothetical protein
MVETQIADQFPNQPTNMSKLSVTCLFTLQLLGVLHVTSPRAVGARVHLLQQLICEYPCGKPFTY